MSNGKCLRLDDLARAEAINLRWSAGAVVSRAYFVGRTNFAAKCVRSNCLTPGVHSTFVVAIAFLGQSFSELNALWITSGHHASGQAGQIWAMPPSTKSSMPVT